MTARTSAALGLFDGVHLGHRQILRTAAAQEGLVPAVFTFQPSLAAFKSTDGFLYPAPLKEQLLRECGIQSLYAPDFAEIADLSGETFVRDILREHMGAACVVCGRDFRFGKGAACDSRVLMQLCTQYGIRMEIIDDVECAGSKVSSTRIRSLLRAGSITEANMLLGIPYRIQGQVLHGAQLGRTIGFPTVNLAFAEGQLVPCFGVYASETVTPQGHFLSVTDIGVKPTVGYAGLPLAETHILDFSGDLYGQEITVFLTGFLRREQRFDSLESLTAQLHSDIARRRQLSGNYHAADT